MEKTYCQFPVSGSSWSSFPDPDEDDESEGIADVQSVEKICPGSISCEDFAVFQMTYQPSVAFVVENNNGLEEQHATRLRRKGN